MIWFGLVWFYGISTIVGYLIQFRISTQFSSIWPADRTLSDATILGVMAMKGTPHSPKLQHYWNLTIRLFSVISRTLVGGVLLFCRDAISIFCILSWLSQFIFVYMYIYIYIYICTYINSHPLIYKRFSITTQEPSIKITIKITYKSLKQYALKILKKPKINKITF